jgi:AcrR family transcriptional regulator
MRPRDEAKRRAILAATLEEVAQVGLAGLSMEAVARRAKVATGTVYIYFTNKDALIDALYRDTKQELTSLFCKDEGLPLRPAFQRICLAYLDYLTRHQTAMIFLAQAAGSPSLSEQTRAEAGLGMRPLHEMLERGKRELLLKNLDTPFMMAFLNATLRDLASLAAADPPAQRKQRFEQIVALCWDALRA